MQQPQSTARRQKSSMALDNEARETIATYSTSPDRAVYADVEGVWAKNRAIELALQRPERSPLDAVKEQMNRITFSW